jgi:glucose dehydrogenase
MYVHTPFPDTVYALNLKDENKIVWKYEPKQDPNAIPVMCCDTVNRGVSYGDGKIYLHQANTTLVALDAKTGKVIWSVKNGDPSKGETGTSSPSVSEGSNDGEPADQPTSPLGIRFGRMQTVQRKMLIGGNNDCSSPR